MSKNELYRSGFSTTTFERWYYYLALMVYCSLIWLYTLMFYTFLAHLFSDIVDGKGLQIFLLHEDVSLQYFIPGVSP